MNSNTIPIKLVHITNPSRFYFRNLLNEKEEIHQIQDIEGQIESYVESLTTSFRNSLKFYQPKIGEIVAFYSKEDKKWIRCEVDESKSLNDIPTVILWAIDYGVPLHTTHLINMIPLPVSFRNPKTMIQTGCLALMPCSPRSDYQLGGVVKDIKERWGVLAIRTMMNLTHNYKKVHFVPSHQIMHDEIQLGDLFFGTDSLSYCLISKEAADTVPATLFLNYHSKLFTHHIERWNDNDRTGGVLKCPDASEFNYRFSVEIHEEEVENPSKVSSFAANCVRKVQEWQDRNEEFFNVPARSEYSFGSQPDIPKLANSPAAVESQVDEFSGVSAEKLRKELHKMKVQAEEIKKTRPGRKIMLPAGSSLAAFNKSSSMIDENFTSVSQISSACHIGRDDYNTDEIDGFGFGMDTIDSVTKRLKSQNI